MHPEILKYNKSQEANLKKVCDLLAREIDANLPEAESRIWHAHPVWFFDGNPTVGYSRQKPGISNHSAFCLSCSSGIVHAD